MSFTPLQVHHPAQRYAALPVSVVRQDLRLVVPELSAQVYAWLTQQRVAVTGAPLIRYLHVDAKSQQVDVHVGFPIGDVLPVSQPPFVVDTLAAGTYVTAVHRGAYDRLADTTAMLLDWGRSHGVHWCLAGSDHAHWVARVEHYLVGPPAETHSAHWHTEVAILRHSIP